jgi:hypothetical protein
MLLFLMDHSPAKIMILACWSSDAFLVYIRPQVLKWTHNMSWDMIHLDSFFDAAHQDLVVPDDHRTHKHLTASFNGRDSVVTIPKFYIEQHPATRYSTICCPNLLLGLKRHYFSPSMMESSVPSTVEYR